MRVEDLDGPDKEQLIADVATRAGTAKQIASWYELDVAELKDWVTENRAAIEAYNAADDEPEADEGPEPETLTDLWISNKFERLKRLQQIADVAYEAMKSGRMEPDATLLREFRSYLALAANELGQLLHRGSGEQAEGDTLQIDIQGVDLETMK